MVILPIGQRSQARTGPKGGCLSPLRSFPYFWGAERVASSPTSPHGAQLPKGGRTG